MAHELITEKVQLARPLASMWKGEYIVSAVGASIVSAPDVGSSLIASSPRIVIFMAHRRVQGTGLERAEDDLLRATARQPLAAAA